MNTEFLKAVETGKYERPRGESAQLYNLLVYTGSEIDAKRFALPWAARPSHPAVLDRAAELISESKKAMLLNEYDAQEIRDNVDIATALTRWAYADTYLSDPLMTAYSRGLLTIEEWVRLAFWQDLGLCECDGKSIQPCGFCKAMGEIKEIENG